MKKIILISYIVSIIYFVLNYYMWYNITYEICLWEQFCDEWIFMWISIFPIVEIIQFLGFNYEYWPLYEDFNLFLKLLFTQTLLLFIVINILCSFVRKIFLKLKNNLWNE